MKKTILKYCEKEPQVSINLEKTDKLLEIRIKDNGIGIDKKYLTQIFDKFYHKKFLLNFVGHLLNLYNNQ